MCQHSYDPASSQISLADWIEQLDKAGLLHRYTDEKRVDELPRIMEDNPNQAVLVERVKDSTFPFFANGYASRAMYALALGCDPKQTARAVGRRTQMHRPAQLVETAPCKDVILKGDEIDLTIFRCPKTYQLFMREEGAEEHCQEGALLLLNQRVFECLDETLQVREKKRVFA